MEPRVQLGSVPFSMQALTVPDGSITAEKIADGAVTSEKLASGDIKIQGDLTVEGYEDAKNIRFGNNVVLREDGGRHLHLLPWGGPDNRWDDVCIGCGSHANLVVKGNVTANNVIEVHEAGHELIWGNTVVNAQDGYARVNYGRSFANGTDVVIAANGDYNAGNFFVNIATRYRDGFNVRLINSDGSPRNGLSRILYIAIGH